MLQKSEPRFKTEIKYAMHNWRQDGSIYKMQLWIHFFIKLTQNSETCYTHVFYACIFYTYICRKVKDNEDYTLDYKPPRQHMMINTITYKNTLPYTTIIGLTEIQIIYVNYQYTKIFYYVFVY